MKVLGIAFHKPELVKKEFVALDNFPEGNTAYINTVSLYETVKDQLKYKKIYVFDHPTKLLSADIKIYDGQFLNGIYVKKTWRPKKD